MTDMEVTQPLLPRGPFEPSAKTPKMSVETPIGSVRIIPPQEDTLEGLLCIFTPVIEEMRDKALSLGPDSEIGVINETLKQMEEKISSMCGEATKFEDFYPKNRPLKIFDNDDALYAVKAFMSLSVEKMPSDSDIGQLYEY
jgi:hypothetical protein